MDPKAQLLNPKGRPLDAKGPASGSQGAAFGSQEVWGEWTPRCAASERYARVRPLSILITLILGAMSSSEAIY